MRTRLGKPLVTLLLIMAVGGHWALLQSVAWVSMVIEYSQDASMAAAVSKTFDGAHPCGICKFVKHGMETEGKRDAAKVKTKIDFWMPAQGLALKLSQEFSTEQTSFDPTLTHRTDSPPVPPPRLS